MIEKPTDIGNAPSALKNTLTFSNGCRQPYFFKKNFLTKDECEKLWSLWNDQDVFIENVDTEDSPWYKYFREKRSRQHMFLPNYIDWLEPKIDRIVAEANSGFFFLDLSFGCLSKQLILYNENHWFDIHDDTNHWDNFHHDRKITLIIQLSDESEYLGGETLVEQHLNISMPKNLKMKGSILIFPTFAIHSVNKIISGSRKAFICWYGGPKFR